MNKKILIGAVVIIVLIVAIIIAITVKQKRQSNLESQTQLTKVSEDKVFFPNISPDGERILFFSSTKEPSFYQMDKNGKNVKQISDPIDTPEEIIWSPDSKLAILRVIYNQYIFEKYGSKFASPGTPDQDLTTWIYNIESKTFTKLDNKIRSIIWTNDNKIIYQYLDYEKNLNRLSAANADGSNESKIIDLPSLLDYSFNLFPDNQSLVIYSVPSDISESTIYTLSLDSKELKTITKVDGPTKAIGTLNEKIFFTIPSKTDSFEINLLSQDSLKGKNMGLTANYLNVVNLNTNAALVIANNGSIKKSAIFSIDLSKNKLTQIQDLSKENIDIQSMFITPDNKTLYLTSDDYLYSLTLP